MKRKSNKVNKAQEFLTKYQYGGFNIDDTLMSDPYSYAPDLQTSQQQQLVQLNQPKSQMAYQPAQQVAQAFDPIPLIGPAINLGIGIKNIFDSFKERKRQKQYKRAYQKDLDKRMEESRVGDYYRVPTQFGWSNSSGSYKTGGNINNRIVIKSGDTYKVLTYND